MTVSRSYLHDVRLSICRGSVTANGQLALESIPRWSLRRRRQRGQGCHRHLSPQLLCPSQLSYSISPLRNWPVSWFLFVYPGVEHSREIPAFTIITSTLSTLGLIPATVPSFWSKTTFSSVHRVPCILRTVVTLLPGGTTSAAPVTRLPPVLSPLSPIPTRCVQPAPSGPPSSLMSVPTSPSEHRCIWMSPGTADRGRR